MTHESERNRTPRETLHLNQERALNAILGGASLTEAAELVGVRRATVSNWVNHDPTFIAHYRSRQHDLWSATRHELLQVQRDLVRAKLDGVRALQALAQEEGASAADRIRAAKALADLPLPTPGEKAPARACTPAMVVEEQERRRVQRVRDRASTLQLDEAMSGLVSQRFLDRAAQELSFS